MLDTLRKIVQDVTQEGNFAASVQTLVSSVRSALGTEVCSIYLVSADRGGYVLAATQGLNQAQIGQTVLSRSQGLVGLVGTRAEP